MKKKLTSAGFVIATLVDGGLTKNYKYLLCHASGSGTTKGWGIPKGKSDEGEKLLQTAIRETKEETGLDLSLYPKVRIDPSVYFTYTLKDKIVYVFEALDDEGILQSFKLDCKSEYSPGKPEIDKFKWVDLNTAIKMATDSQKGLFKHIAEYGL